jgi:hypothetical protein
MADSRARVHLRRELEAHLTRLGYSSIRARRAAVPLPEIARVSPVRGRLAYGETVVHADLQRRRCHERLLFFSQRRTRHRSSILFFIGVSETDQAELEALLEQLGIRNGVRGGHVHVVPIAAPTQSRRSANSPGTGRGARRGSSRTPG